MELDVEAVHEVSGKRPFDRWLAILVGIAAVLGATLATLQADASKQEERALLMASRLSVRVFEGTAGGSPRVSFEINSLQSAIELGITSTARQIAALEHPEVSDIEVALAEPDQRASERLFAIATAMSQAPSSGVDPLARELLAGDLMALDRVANEQRSLIDLADRFGERGGRTILALSVLALGAVLIGLGAVLGVSRPGRIALLAATLALIAAAGWGASSLVV